MNRTNRPLFELCDRNIELRDPKDTPDVEFLYVDIGSVNNRTKFIKSASPVKGSQASVRARQVMHAGDVLVSTVRPNLNTVALVPAELNGAICSTGFCVLRPGPELCPGYLFAFVQSSFFIGKLVEFVQGALYPAVTDRQVFAVEIPWVEPSVQKTIASLFSFQSAAIIDARQAIQKQLEELNLLSQKLLAQVFQE